MKFTKVIEKYPLLVEINQNFLFVKQSRALWHTIWKWQDVKYIHLIDFFFKKTYRSYLSKDPMGTDSPFGIACWIRYWQDSNGGQQLLQERDVAFSMVISIRKGLLWEVGRKGERIAFCSVLKSNNKTGGLNWKKKYPCRRSKCLFQPASTNWRRTYVAYFLSLQATSFFSPPQSFPPYG